MNELNGMNNNGNIITTILNWNKICFKCKLNVKVTENLRVIYFCFE